MAAVLNQSAKTNDYNHKMSSGALSSAGDDELVSWMAGGDERAFAELYQRHSTPVFNYLLRLVHEPTDAEDLLQEAFVAVWRGAAGYRGQAQVKTWIYRIAHNLAVSWLRRRKPVLAFEDLDGNGHAHEPEQILLDHTRDVQLHRALDQLSPKHRAVLELAFVQEMPYQEIAIILGCPVGTIKSRMSYALKALKQSREMD